MPKLSIEDLQSIREKTKGARDLREGGRYKARICVHMGTCGIAAGARSVMEAFLNEIRNHETDDVLLTNSGCAGLCSREPMATVEYSGQSPVKYVDLTPEKTNEIFEQHVLQGHVVEKYALASGSERTM
jgi:NADP-reducing hydrogenase subunit HndB